MQTRRRPLVGKRVVVTRPRGREAELARALSALGARVLFAPLVRVAPPRSFARLDAALRALGEFDACAFASASAVESFFSRARALRVWPKRPRVLLAVGPATARALADRGWRGARLPKEQTGAGLSRALGRARGLRVLVPQAEDGREELAAGLSRAGSAVLRVDAYRTLPDPRGAAALARAARGTVDAVCFASPSAARAFFRALGAARARRLLSTAAAAAIGPTPAAELSRLGAPRVAEAKRPSGAALAEALRIFFNSGDGPLTARRRPRRAR